MTSNKEHGIFCPQESQWFIFQPDVFDTALQMCRLAFILGIKPFNNYDHHKPHRLVYTTTVVEAAATKPKQETDQQVLLGGRPFVAMQVIVHRTLSRPRKNIIKIVSWLQKKAKKHRGSKQMLMSKTGTYSGAGSPEGGASGEAIRLKGEQELPDNQTKHVRSCFCFICAGSTKAWLLALFANRSSKPTQQLCKPSVPNSKHRTI